MEAPRDVALLNLVKKIVEVLTDPIGISIETGNLVEKFRKRIENLPVEGLQEISNLGDIVYSHINRIEIFEFSPESETRGLLGDEDGIENIAEKFIIRIYDAILKAQGTIKNDTFFWGEPGRNDGILDLDEDDDYIDPYADLRNILRKRVNDSAINYHKLRPPFVKHGRIPEAAKKLYSESRWCYIFQNYSAAVALSRTILELSLKDRFEKFIDIRIGTAKQWLNMAYKNKKISKQVFCIGKDVILEANDVLHDGKTIDEERALEVIEQTKDFLEQIYKD